MDSTKDETTMPEAEPLTEEMKARVLSIFTPPFRFSMGYVLDSTSRSVADLSTDDASDVSIAALRMRGWGRLTGKGGGLGLSEDAAYEIQCAAGQMFAEAFNAHWYPTPTPPSIPVERVEAILESLQISRNTWETCSTPAAEGSSASYRDGRIDGIADAQHLLGLAITEARS